MTGLFIAAEIMQRELFTLGIQIREFKRDSAPERAAALQARCDALAPVVQQLESSAQAGGILAALRKAEAGPLCQQLIAAGISCHTMTPATGSPYVIIHCNSTTPTQNPSKDKS